MSQEYIKKTKDDFMEIITKIQNKEVVYLDNNSLIKCNLIKIFLIQNSELEVSKEIIELLKEYYIKELNNPKLIDALNIDDKLKFKKDIEIYNNLPLINNANIAFFYNTLYVPNKYYGKLANYYKALFWFIQNNDGLIDRKLENSLNSFMESNINLFKYSKNKYNSLEEEKNNHYKAQRGIINNDYLEFSEKMKSIGALEGNYLNDTQIYFQYLRQKIGNISELEFFKYLKKLPNTYHIAAELGDGFGYDIYSYDEKREVEQLIEVKATTNLDKTDFSLNDNEYQTMIKVLDNPNAEYYVSLVYVDLSNNYHTTYLLLKAVDEYTLTSGDGKIEYIIDHNDKDKISFIQNSYVKRR